MTGRQFSTDNYRYGFNGKENDTHWGDQLIQDYGFRLYNPAIAKFLSVDPLSPDYPELTPYQFAHNDPVEKIDLDGLEGKSVASNSSTYSAPKNRSRNDYLLKQQRSREEIRLRDQAYAEAFISEGLRNPDLHDEISNISSKSNYFIGGVKMFTGASLIATGSALSATPAAPLGWCLLCLGKGQLALGGAQFGAQAVGDMTGNESILNLANEVGKNRNPGHALGRAIEYTFDMETRTLSDGLKTGNDLINVVGGFSKFRYLGKGGLMLQASIAGVAVENLAYYNNPLYNALVNKDFLQGMNNVGYMSEIGDAFVNLESDIGKPKLLRQTQKNIKNHVDQVMESGQLLSVDQIEEIKKYINKTTK